MVKKVTKQKVKEEKETIKNWIEEQKKESINYLKKSIRKSKHLINMRLRLSIAWLILFLINSGFAIMNIKTGSFGFAYIQLMLIGFSIYGFTDTILGYHFEKKYIYIFRKKLKTLQDLYEK